MRGSGCLIPQTLYVQPRCSSVRCHTIYQHTIAVLLPWPHALPSVSHLEYLFFLPDSIWVGVNAASQNGRPITGILNPNSGPYTANEFGTTKYKEILTYLKKGNGVDPQNEHLTVRHGARRQCGFLLHSRVLICRRLRPLTNHSIRTTIRGPEICIPRFYLAQPALCFRSIYYTAPVAS